MNIHVFDALDDKYGVGNWIIKDGEVYVNGEKIETENLDKLIEAFNLKVKAEEFKGLVTSYVISTLNKYDYDNEGELALYCSNEDSIWNKEARELRKWIEDTYKLMYELAERIENGEIEINVENFKENIPLFIKG